MACQNRDNLKMMFKLHSKFKPAGDQPQAIDQLTKNIQAGVKHQVLLGVTGSGKTFTMANVIEKIQKPTLVISHNKTLAAQLYQEFKEFFPANAVHYFVSYYDYYQPEAYIPQTDTYIEKDAKINEELDRLRHAATQSLLARPDTIIVASVSCIYNIGSPEEYQNLSVEIKKGQNISRQTFLRQLAALQYLRSDINFKRGSYRVRGESLEIWLATGEQVLRITFGGSKISQITSRQTLTIRDFFTAKEINLSSVQIYPAKFWVSPQEKINLALANIRAELDGQLSRLKKEGKLFEAERLRRRTNFDLEMLKETGYCHGVENYSRHLEFRQPGDAPFTLLDFFSNSHSHKFATNSHNSPNGFLTIIDESHMSIPQIGGMYFGDRSRKETLIEFGFRLPSALDNRPLKFQEFEKKVNQVIYVSATPGKYELGKAQMANRPLRRSVSEASKSPLPVVPALSRNPESGSRVPPPSRLRRAGKPGMTKKEKQPLPSPLLDKERAGVGSKTFIIEQLVRPTGLLDPKIEVRPTKNQIPDLISEIKKRVAQKQRILVTTLTKRMAEDLADYLTEEKIKTQYLHSEIKTLERPEILKDLRLGKYDVVVGANLLREGLDLPEVSLVAILDADKEGFLRNETTLIQTVGRVSRHPQGLAIMYADKITYSIKRAIEETNRRRKIQEDYNKKHGIKPQPIRKAIRPSIVEVQKPAVAEASAGKEYLKEYIKELQFKMDLANRNLQFDEAMKIKTEVDKLKRVAKK
ncbi:MAG: excinuclease ABC subunit B [Parcubacteria group bacterium LiPW_39]|nr:MAG: excinuclease ABC subunit B [Parcubacteria group bacterium LiPW_39]